jgi:hypothetical protein
LQRFKFKVPGFKFSRLKIKVKVSQHKITDSKFHDLAFELLVLTFSKQFLS